MNSITMGKRFFLARTEYNQFGSQTIGEVASITGVSKSLISDIETDKGRKFNFIDAANLARHYGVSLDWLVGLTNIRSANMEIKHISSLTGLSEDNIKHLWGDSAATESFKFVLDSLATAVFHSPNAVNDFISAILALDTPPHSHPENSLWNFNSEYRELGIVALLPREAARYFLSRFAEDIAEELRYMYLRSEQTPTKEG